VANLGPRVRITAGGARVKQKGEAVSREKKPTKEGKGQGSTR